MASIEEIIEAAAELEYNMETENHPTIHSNRFPSWGELREKERERYRQSVLDNMKKA